MPSPVESLPGELLIDCFSYLELSRPSIHSLRLTSRHFHDLSSPFLITAATVHFTAQSFSALSRLASHHVFSKSVKSININVCYYDKMLAKDLFCYAFTSKNLMTRFLTTSEGTKPDETHTKYNDIDPESYERGLEIGRQWLGIEAKKFKLENASSEQRFLFEMWTEYGRLYEEQQALIVGEAGAAKLVKILAQFPALAKLAITDDSKDFEDGDEKTPTAVIISEFGLKKCCMSPIRWKSIQRYETTTKPPTFILPKLFTALAASSIRVPHFAIQLSAPVDLDALLMSETEYDAARKMVSRAETVSFRMWHWSRYHIWESLATRSAQEFPALHKLTRALFASPMLKTMDIALAYHISSMHWHDVIVVYDNQPPAMTFSDLIPPLDTCAASLRSISLTSVPITLKELETLAETMSDHLTSLELHLPYLLGGNWEQALDTLRGLERLEHVKLRMLRGRDRQGLGADPPLEEMGDFLVGRKSDNPLHGLHMKSGAD